MNTAIVNQSYLFVKWLYREFLPSGYRDLQIDLAMELKNTCISRGLHFQFTDQELEVIALAALFHNCGCIEGQDEDRKASLLIARNFLQEQKYQPVKIKKVLSCIQATREGAAAHSRIEKLIQRVRNQDGSLRLSCREEVGDIWP